jgi:signal recognition particle subunit SRP54
MNRIPANAQVDEKALVRVEAIIQSMTREERNKPQILNGTRRKRIAAGSGTSIQEVNKMLKQFAEMQKMMKTLSKGKIPGMLRGMRAPSQKRM